MNNIVVSMPQGTSQSVDGREAVTTLIYMKGGMEDQKTATLYMGDGYSFYLIDYTWVSFLSDAWYLDGVLDTDSPENQAYMLVGNYEGMDVSQVENMLTAQGYAIEGGELWKLENGIISRIRCYETKRGIKTLNCVCSQEAEEGWGAELRAMADTFAVYY